MKKGLAVLLIMAVMAVPAYADGYSDMLERAESYALSGDYDHALAAYELAARARPEDAEPYMGAAWVYSLMGDDAAALAKVDDALERDPLSAPAWEARCRLDIAREDVDSFEGDLLFAQVCGVDLSGEAASIAVMYASAGRAEKAAAYFDQVYLPELDEAQREAYRRALIATGQREKAGELGLSPASWRNEKLDAAFDRDELRLVEVEWPEVTAEQFVIPEEYWAAMDFERPDDPMELLAQTLREDEIRILSLSPSGDSGLFLLGDAVAAYSGGQYRFLYPAYERGVEDEYGNLAKYSGLLSRILGEEGVVYSRDGRYAAMYSVEYSLYRGMYIFDPIVLDLATGEAFLAVTYANRPREENMGTVTTAFFSQDGRYFYYLLYGNTTENRCALYRYDLRAETTELCCSVPYFTYYPQMAEMVDGSVLLLEDVPAAAERNGVVEVACREGEWVAERHPFSQTTQNWYGNRLNYSRNSGFALVTGRTLKQLPLSFAAIRPDEGFAGLDAYYSVDRESGQIVAVDPGEMAAVLAGAWDAEGNTLNREKLPYGVIEKAALSPDGYYALILVRNGADARLLLARLETMECREVAGIDPLTISPAGDTAYSPIIEWNGDTLIIGTEDGTRTYRFE